MNERTPLRIMQDQGLHSSSPIVSIETAPPSSTSQSPYPSSKNAKPIISSPLVRGDSSAPPFTILPNVVVSQQKDNSSKEDSGASCVGNNNALARSLQSLSPKLSKVLTGSESEIAATLASPAKVIGALGSLALIANNTTGPGMMALPQQFQVAGIIPTTLCIIFVCVGASLTTTLMADTIAAIPGNAEFSRPIDFPTAFRMIVGKKWSRVVEMLFICSCFVQAIASLVETAQSLDGFLASLLVGWTAAVKIEYNRFPEIVYWTPSECFDEISTNGDLIDADLEDCVPFAKSGALVLSLGYVLTSLLFFSFGLGNLKETIGMQLISFGCFFVLLSQFIAEFIDRGIDFSSVPWFGDSIFQLAGVVLFNFAFSVTVPSWLSEKEPNVSVNRTIWGSSILSCLVYILFGTMGALSFSEAPGNMLILLASKKVCLLTRICAALFGITIIGAGVPVFCVIIKTTLYNSAGFSARWAVFCGAFVPYLISWSLYQGEKITTLLNWAGLVINGLVAFILPLVITYKALESSKHRNKGNNLFNGGGKDNRYNYEAIGESGDLGRESEKMGASDVTSQNSGHGVSTYPSNENDDSSDVSDGEDMDINLFRTLEDMYVWARGKLQSLQHAGTEEWRRRFGEEVGFSRREIGGNNGIWQEAAKEIDKTNIPGSFCDENDDDEVGFQDSPIRQSLDSDVGFIDSPTSSPIQSVNHSEIQNGDKLGSDSKLLDGNSQTNGHVGRPTNNGGRLRSLSGNDLDSDRRADLIIENDNMGKTLDRNNTQKPKSIVTSKKSTPFFKASVKNVVQPLPPWLEEYKPLIVKVFGIAFAFIVAFTIMLDLFEGISPSEDLDP